MKKQPYDWAAIEADPKFQSLHYRKRRFLTSMMLLAIAYFFMLPIGAAYFQEIFRIKVYGVVNFAILFALSQFVVAWTIAIVYTRKANSDFDRAAEEIVREAAEKYEKN